MRMRMRRRILKMWIEQEVIRMTKVIIAYVVGAIILGIYLIAIQLFGGSNK